MQPGRLLDMIEKTLFSISTDEGRPSLNGAFFRATADGGFSMISTDGHRLSRVVLAAATTVLGVIPLLQDVFWVGMAVTIMAGLAFGTVLTMILVPVFYATFYGLRSPAAGDRRP